ncbi:hypothetical protein H6F77_20510 [Microcoleus sp. FACHB-831]|uniref:hypothetical protein n=1 Tax=Microcoleus sp. FACHB-831 TaxID=2692827 RepID=UPI001685ACA3|nr:hypothetical protein [Microcoleus sp. FACHB-831]MBD1923435.1 hypothetical protein [Microcoleus sp. FACHB-831]
MTSQQVQLGKYLTLEEFCTCSKTYNKYAGQINPFPQNLEDTILAIQDLNQFILNAIVEYFGLDKFKLTYGFCSKDLKKYLDKKDPETGNKNGRVAPELDQHMAHEMNKNGNYYCKRLGAACDFIIIGEDSDRVVDWILAEKLPFDSIYYYGADRPIHISYGPQHKRDIRTFTATGQPTQKGIQHWVELAERSRL